MRKRTSFVLAFLILTGLHLSADELPALQPASEITEGVLQNGIKYYLVANPNSGSYADFAVVQRNYTDPDKARHNLVDLPHFGRRRPCDFLADHGVPYTESGFVSFRGGSTWYDFPSVPLSPQAVCDSTLLMLLDIASTCPGDQAIVVSGGVDVARIKDRLDLLSITISPREAGTRGDDYVWEPITSTSVYYSGSPCADVSSLKITYSSARTPFSKMNTVQPLVTRQYSMYLGNIIGKRIRTAFRVAGIPLADLQYRYRDSSEGPGNELYTLTVTTSPSNLSAAVRDVAAIMADIDCRGVTSGELEDARNGFVMAASRDRVNRIVTDSEYIAKCAKAFLYGASLASDATVNDIFARSSLSVSAELPIFNMFVSALLDSSSNLILGFDTPGSDSSQNLESAFLDAWRSAVKDKSSVPAVPQRCPQIDPEIVKNKSKIEERQADALTGGTMLKMSNGLRVICRKTDLKGEIRYSFLINGGFATTSGFSSRDGAFLTDLLNLCEVSGMSGEQFREFLSSMGITFCAEVTPSDLRITGKAPSDKVPEVLKALSLFSGVRTIPREEFDYYRKTEALSQKVRKSSETGVAGFVDSLLYTGGMLWAGKDMNCLDEELLHKALNYFIGQFGRFTSGVLSIMGDVDVNEMEKPLCQILGGVEPTSSSASRARVTLSSPGGSTTVHGQQGAASSAHLAWSFQYLSNDAGRTAVRAAIMALDRELPKVLMPLGYSYSVEKNTTFYPQDQESVYINLAPCSRSGLPEGFSIAPLEEAVSAVEDLVVVLSSSPVELAPIKNNLSRVVAMETSDADYLTDAVMVRYSAGRDIVSGGSKAVQGLTGQQIQAVYREMSSGRHVRYLVP